MIPLTKRPAWKALKAHQKKIKSLHPKVLRVVALSGGYSREEANNRLRTNHGIVASFSRALAEGLSAQQSDAQSTACWIIPFKVSLRRPIPEPASQRIQQTAN